jgi:hypothetical protein
MHCDVMQQRGTDRHRRISIAKQSRIGPNILRNEFHLRLQYPIDVIASMIRVIRKKRQLIVGKNLPGSIGQCPDRRLEVAIFEQQPKRLRKFDLGH